MDSKLCLSRSDIFEMLYRKYLNFQNQSTHYVLIDDLYLGMYKNLQLTPQSYKDKEDFIDFIKNHNLLGKYYIKEYLYFPNGNVKKLYDVLVGWEFLKHMTTF